ncbi:MAG: SPASM domain-containing protein [Syntrophales bacterium]
MVLLVHCRKKPQVLQNAHLEFFIDNGLNRLQFIPCVEINGETGAPEEYSVTAGQYRDFLCTLFDEWYNNGHPAASVRLFENILALYLGREPELCAFKDRCGSYVVVEYNGDVYPCDFFVEERWMLGNLPETPIGDMMKKRKRREFNNRKRAQTSGSSACEWNFLCHFGCQPYRSSAGGNYLCGAYREFFRYTGQRFHALAKSISTDYCQGAKI